MSEQRTFSNEEAVAHFVRAGVKEMSDAGNIVFSKPIWTMREMRIVLSAISRIGANSVGAIFLSTNTAMRQAIRKFERAGTTTLIGPIMCDTAIQFLPSLVCALDDRQLKKDGYSFRVFSHGDAPFSMSVELLDPEKNPRGENRIIGTFNFDLFIRNGRPAIVLGNFQGYDRERIERFKHKYRKSLLDYFLARVERGFPSHTRRLALNPRRHLYRNPSITVILNKLVERGEIAQEDIPGYRVPAFAEKYQIPADRIAAIAKLAEAERRRIITTGTGMHAAAYVKAQYQRSKSRFWRPKPKRMPKIRKRAKKR